MSMQQTVGGVGKRPSILIVDDDEDILEVLRDALEMSGYRVASARNGECALTYLRSTPDDLPCVIFLDLMMPVMNGEDFLAAKRLLPELAAVPVVVMSAVHTRGTPAGATLLMRKPFDYFELGRIADEFARRGRVSTYAPLGGVEAGAP
jgi:CheY-like chemotaxis protein